ncbi:hypothetical protein [Nocardiopsis synnemataformans]|uniref:hypothetical protein n=1 Tax=Nocardiopsis synnemataformans TaxID=61305 RepID=UPI003EBBA993
MIFDSLIGSVADWVGEGITGLSAIAINAFISMLKLFLMSWALKPTVSVTDADLLNVQEGDGGGAGPSAAIQDQLIVLVAIIAICSLLAASARLAWMRRVEPLTNVASGIITLVITTFLGLAIAEVLIRFSDDLSSYLILNTLEMNALQPEQGLMENNLQVLAYAFFMLIVALLGLLFLFAQMAFMLLRDASLIVLAGVLPLAAVGKMIPGTKWFEKITGWMLALIFYKPCAVMVMWVGFMLLQGGQPDLSNSTEMFGDDALDLNTSSPQELGFTEAEDAEEDVTLDSLLNMAYTMTMGVIVLGLALLAMPVMVKLFDFTVGHVGGFANPAPALLNAAVSAGTAAATGGASAAGEAAASQAGNINAGLGNLGDGINPPKTGAGPGGDGQKVAGSPGDPGGGQGSDVGAQNSGDEKTQQPQETPSDQDHPQGASQDPNKVNQAPTPVPEAPPGTGADQPPTGTGAPPAQDGGSSSENADSGGAAQPETGALPTNTDADSSTEPQDD